MSNGAVGPIAPVKLTLADGIERTFRLSLGAIRRLRDKHGIDLLRNREGIADMQIESLTAIIHEGLANDRPATLEETEDLVDLRQLGELVRALTQAISTGEAKEERPTEAPGEVAPEAE